MREQLREKIGPEVRESVPLAPHTTFRIGGPAAYFYEAADSDGLVRAVTACRELEADYLLLGGGSNLLIADRGYGGLAIKSMNTAFRIEGDKAVAEASAPMAEVVAASLEAGMAGLQWASGLPGSVGGAVRGNAGCFGANIGQQFLRAEVLTPEGVKTFSRKDMRFGYRDSIIKHTDYIILSVTLELDGTVDRAEARATAKQCLDYRANHQPKYPSAGCIFKNLFVDELDNHARSLIPDEVVRDGKLGAGWLIDQADLKGKRVGGAMVSPMHANFIVNTGQATADDVVILISLIKQKVRDTFGVQLELEIQLVGF